MAQHFYRIEIQLSNGEWQELFGAQDISKAYMQGRFEGFRDQPGPRRAYRLVRVNLADLEDPPKVLDEIPELKDLSVGWMPAAQGHRWASYVMAAARALRVAALDVQHAAKNDPALSGHDATLQALATEVEALWTSTLRGENS